MYINNYCTLIIVFIIVAFPLALTGCSTSCVIGIGCSPSVDVQVKGEKEMNGGNAASVVIYQLSNDAKFRTTPIEEFWRDDEAVLGDELVGRRREVLMYPLQIRFIEVEVEENTNFIAVAANLRNPEADAWRRIFPVKEVVGERVQVCVADTTLDITVE